MSVLFVQPTEKSALKKKYEGGEDASEPLSRDRALRIIGLFA